VHVRSLRSRELISMYRMRDVLVSSRVKAINSVRGWLRTKNQRLAGRNVATFTTKIRKLLDDSGLGRPAFVERTLVAIDQLNAQVVEATKELRTIARTDSTCRLLMTAPGVGPLTAVRFVAALDEIGRFPNAHAVQSYLGLTPGENSSSGRKQRLSITKAGPGDVRKLLVQASWTAWRTSPEDPLVRWGRRVAERRGTKIAMVAIARKLSGVLYALWRDQRPYDATRLARDSLKARLESLA
jgi:transposase